MNRTAYLAYSTRPILPRNWTFVKSNWKIFPLVPTIANPGKIVTSFLAFRRIKSDVTQLRNLLECPFFVLSLLKFTSVLSGPVNRRDANRASIPAFQLIVSNKWSSARQLIACICGSHLIIDAGSLQHGVTKSLSRGSRHIASSAIVLAFNAALASVQQAANDDSDERKIYLAIVLSKPVALHARHYPEIQTSNKKTP